MVNSDYCSLSIPSVPPSVLMSAVTGCKLVSLGWNKIESPNTFLRYFSCDQAVLRTVLSVRPSVRRLHLFRNVPVIVPSWNFHKWLPSTEVMSVQKVKVKGQGQRGQNKFAPIWAFLDRNSSLNSLVSVKWCTNIKVANEGPFVWQGHPSNYKVTCMGQKSRKCWSELSVLGL